MCQKVEHKGKRIESGKGGKGVGKEGVAGNHQFLRHLLEHFEIRNPLGVRGAGPCFEHASAEPYGVETTLIQQHMHDFQQAVAVGLLAGNCAQE